MHVLIPFDLVPTDSSVPQAAFGFAPVSEHAIRYALTAFGQKGDLEITAVHLSTDSIDLEENIGAATIRSLAEDLGTTVDVSVHSVQDAQSIDEIQEGILDLLEGSAVDTVVLGYENRSFVESVFTESTPHAILEDRETPVVLVPETGTE